MVFAFLFSSPEQKIAARLHKANRLYTGRRFAEAAKLYRQILKIDAFHFAATANLAVSYFELGNYLAALPYFLTLIKNDSSNPWWHNYLSQVYQNLGHYPAALEAARKAVELSNGAAEHQLNLAYAVYETADVLGREPVDPILQKWYAAYPQNPIVRQCYKSFFFDENFTCCEPEYVAKMFDVFAPDFDNVLAGLHYDSPQTIAALLYDFLPVSSSAPVSVLDLGCGSGLCGAAIRKQIKNTELTGVDISAEMLRQAEHKHVYKELVHCNITDCFDKIKCNFDVAVAADVFTYFGILDSLFVGISGVLKKGGFFAFTISQNDFNDKDFFLMPSSRFVHSLVYVKKQLSAAGFLIVFNTAKNLRSEGGRDVAGQVVLAVKK